MPLQDSGDAAQFVMIERLWLVLPFMHSEKLHDQQVWSQTVSSP